MRKIIFLENKNSYIRIFVLIAILELLTVFLIGYLSVDQPPIVYISIISAIVFVTITVLFLRNINIAVPVLIILLPIQNLILEILISKHNLAVVTPFDIFVVSAIICLFLYKSTAKDRTIILKEKTGPGYLSLLLFALVAFGMLSVVWSPNIIHGLSFCIRLILNCLIYLLLVVLLKNQGDVLRAIKTLIFTTVMTAATMMVSIFPIDLLNIKKTCFLTKYLSLRFYFETYQLRASSIMETHIAVTFLTFGVLFSMGILSQSKGKKEKIMLSLIIIFLILSALYTKARGPIASMLVAILFLIFAMKNFRTYFFRNLYLFALCFIFLFGIFITTSSYLTAIIKPYLPTAYYKGEHSFSDRLEYWETAYNALKNSGAYIQGLGAGGATYYLYPVLHTHNICLSIFFDLGLIGLVLFFILISISMTKLFLTIRSLKEGFTKAMLLSTSGCILAIGLASLVDYNYNFYLLWLIMGLGTAIYRYAASIPEESLSNSMSCKK